jgi:hypothetical protein
MLVPPEGALLADGFLLAPVAEGFHHPAALAPGQFLQGVTHVGAEAPHQHLLRVGRQLPQGVDAQTVESRRGSLADAVHLLHRQGSEHGGCRLRTQHIDARRLAQFGGHLGQQPVAAHPDRAAQPQLLPDRRLDGQGDVHRTALDPVATAHIQEGLVDAHGLQLRAEAAQQFHHLQGGRAVFAV